MCWTCPCKGLANELLTNHSKMPGLFSTTDTEREWQPESIWATLFKGASQDSNWSPLCWTLLFHLRRIIDLMSAHGNWKSSLGTMEDGKTVRSKETRKFLANYNTVLLQETWQLSKVRLSGFTAYSFEALKNETRPSLCRNCLFDSLPAYWPLSQGYHENYLLWWLSVVHGCPWVDTRGALHLLIGVVPVPVFYSITGKLCLGGRLMGRGARAAGQLGLPWPCLNFHILSLNHWGIPCTRGRRPKVFYSDWEQWSMWKMDMGLSLIAQDNGKALFRAIVPGFVEGPVQPAKQPLTDSRCS